jgi:hypothetical protein
VIAITGMIHPKTGVCQRRYQILREPGGVLELLKNRIANNVVVVIEECPREDVENFCEWAFRHWAVHNVDGDNKTVIVVSELPGV